MEQNTSSIGRLFHIDDLDYIKLLCTGIIYEDTVGQLSKTSHMFINI